MADIKNHFKFGESLAEEGRKRKSNKNVSGCSFLPSPPQSTNCYDLQAEAKVRLTTMVAVMSISGVHR